MTIYWLFIVAGICDPYNSTECQRLNDWDVCGDDEEFDCPEIENPGISSISRTPNKVISIQNIT